LWNNLKVSFKKAVNTRFVDFKVYLWPEMTRICSSNLRVMTHLFIMVPLNQRPLRIGLGGMEKLPDALQCPEKWKVGFAMIYLKDKVGLWWVTVRERQHKPRLNWKGFKELIKDHF